MRIKRDLTIKKIEERIILIINSVFSFSYIF